ncbi:MAG: hypothetical protein Q7R47_04015 [Candidatus Diapherotrites archaeon]|nr:hypothetical protein [Candidatus Diapherotrites archaeon]
MLTVTMLLFVAVVGGSSFLTFSESVASQTVSDSLRTLQNGVNHVYSLGPGNSLVVDVSLPSSVVDSNVGGLTGTELGFDVSSAFGSKGFFVYTDANVAGALPKHAGNFRIKLVSLGSDVNVAVIG